MNTDYSKAKAIGGAAACSFSDGDEQAPKIKCSHCGKESKFTRFPMLALITDDGFWKHRYTCQAQRTKCGPTISCPDCSMKHLGCCKCGNGEEYC